MIINNTTVVAKDKHYIRAEVTIPSKQTTAFVAITDPMIAEHYRDATALARYRCVTGQDGRYEGLQTNYYMYTPGGNTYGYYKTNAPGQSNSPSITALYESVTSSKSMLADSAGNLKINGTSANYLSAGTYIVDFMW